jgi:hypothetical protein
VNIALTKQDAATPRLMELLQQVKSKDFLVVMVTAVKGEVQRNFQQLGSRGNKNGWPSQNFYAKAARATNSRVAGDVGFVSVNMLGISQRYFGGDITPGKNVNPVTGRLTKYLAIPAREEAYGKRPGEFDDLQVLWGSRGPFALAERQYTDVSFGRERKDGSRKVAPGDEHGMVLYWLTDFVHQEPDPSVLPTAELMSGAAVEAGESWLERNLKS